MKGFIKKDLAIARSNIKMLAVLFVLYTIIGLLGSMDISFMLPFISVMVIISTFNCDALNNWEAYAATLPDGRRNSVKSKYLVTLLIVFASTILSIILSFVIAYVNSQDLNIGTTLLSMIITSLCTLLFECFMFPLIYKYGVEKARIGIFIIIFGIIVIGGFLIQFINLSSLDRILLAIKDYGLIIFITIVGILLYLSYRISLKFQMKKDL